LGFARVKSRRDSTRRAGLSLSQSRNRSKHRLSSMSAKSPSHSAALRAHSAKRTVTQPMKLAPFVLQKRIVISFQKCYFDNRVGNDSTQNRHLESWASPAPNTCALSLKLLRTASPDNCTESCSESINWRYGEFVSIRCRIPYRTDLAKLAPECV
jgi:hypothetical protein